MSLLLNLPPLLQFILVFVVGATAGSAVNWAIHELCIYQRPVSPWSRRRSADPGSSWIERIPILGWFLSFHWEEKIGRRFWVRPLGVEILTGMLFVFLFRWELHLLRIVPAESQLPEAATRPIQAVVGWQCLVHWVLLSLMLVATFIDLDEQTIPDAITVPGTVFFLIIAAIFPRLLLPLGISPLETGEYQLESIVMTSPVSGMPDWAQPRILPGLIMAILGFIAWCLAFLPRLWFTRRGLKTAIRYFIARMVRWENTPNFITLAIVGSLGIAAVWQFGGEDRWSGLLSSITGMLVGGAIIWVIRLCGAMALKEEAMGFGDVTLMAMIGSYFGWQPCLLIVFAAAGLATIVSLARYVASRDRRIYFGPFLCMGAFIVLVFWGQIWPQIREVLRIRGLVPIAVVGMLPCFFLLLKFVHTARLALFGDGYLYEDEDEIASDGAAASNLSASPSNPAANNNSPAITDTPTTLPVETAKAPQKSPAAESDSGKNSEPEKSPTTEPTGEIGPGNPA